MGTAKLPAPDVRISRLADEVGGTMRTYSGRGMDGKECYAISCESADEAIYASAKYELGRPSTDQLGKREIAYWPEHAV